MFIKKIELSGFKSFPVKTSLEFSPGITIIVGPNGCGKSNIFDAIRWVLGEQNARNLRGDRMGDLLFQGSENHPRQNLGQVTLSVDNSQRNLALDFNEIAIARKLYREGDDQFSSEYLINGASCRRKDVTELFMDTGMGASAYSIMEQNQVSLIIQAKPKDRRLVFEEAAGISRYRAQKDAALRKLDHTQKELAMHENVLSVMEREVRKLKRQANKAERYKKVAAEINQLESFSLIEEYRKLIGRQQESEGRLQALNDRLAACRTRLASLEARKEEAALLEQELNQTLNRLQAKDNQLRLELQNCTSRMQLFRERIEALETQRENSRREADETQAQLDDREGLLAQMNGELAKQEERLQSAERLFEEHKQVHDRLMRGQQEVCDRLNALRDALRSHDEELAHVQGDIRLAELKKEEELVQGEALEQKLNTLKDELKLREQKLAQLKKEHAAQQAQLTKTEKKLAQLEKERLAKISAIKTMGKDLDQTLTELAQTTSRFEALKQLEDSYQGFHQGVREVMKAVKQKRFNHIHGVLAQLIEIDNEYEKALEAALAGHLQDLVADDAKSARTAIDYLKSKKLGRATFLPLDLIELRPVHLRILSAVTQPGVVGLAAKLVRCSADIQPAVDFLLGKILVVESLEIAEKMLRGGLRTRYVSLEGDSLTERGMMSGGYIRSSGLLSREREIRKLEQRIGLLKQAETEATPRLAELRQRRLELEDQVLDASEALNNLKVLVAQKRNELQAEENFLQERQLQVDELAAAKRDLGKNRGRRQKEIEKQLKRIDSLHKENASLRSELAEVESGGIVVETDESGEIRNVYAETLRELTAARERSAALRDKKQATEESAGRLRERLNQKLSEVEQLDAQRDAARQEQEAARRELEDKSAAVDKLTKEIAGQAQIREERELSRRQLDNEIQEAVRDEREAQNELQERKIEQAQLESNVQHLDERARERFNRPLAAVAQEAGECELQPDELAARVAQLREKRDSMGEINNSAIDEHIETKERFDQYQKQYHDLVSSRESLLRTIRKIDATALEKFQEAFTAIRTNFHGIFRQLFGGGKADLILTEPEDALNSGIEIVAMPPGSQVRNIMLQSGGEKSMVAVALLFAIFQHKPSPFCVLDEIDHALDDRNIGRFKEMVGQFAEKTQFVIITHNKLTMELADTLYGVTMEEKGVTQLVSVQFNDLQLVG